MDPGEYNIVIRKGASWRRNFIVDDGATPTPAPIDITGCEFRAQIRKKPDAVPVVIDLNTPDEITLTDPTNGELMIFIPHTLTSEMPNGEYGWDIFIEWPNGEDVDMMWYGTVELSPSITKPSVNE